MIPYILFGAGTIGRLIARQLIAKGTLPVAFADNDQSKWGSEIEGILVLSPEDAPREYPDAKWVATIHRTPFRGEILEQLETMGVEQVSLYEFLPARCDLPPSQAIDTIDQLLTDNESVAEWNDQIAFRINPSNWVQRPPRGIANVYFEDFFTHRSDEHFVDGGACAGDTIHDFVSRWDSWHHVSAFEPDPSNYDSLLRTYRGMPTVSTYNFAIGDYRKVLKFTALGDQTSHFCSKGNVSVQCVALDEMIFDTPPTFVKFDIEGAELEGLWGARETIRKHSPVLAICAYHLGSHLWEIPLLIHAINPTYRLYLRRYLEATWELIYYAVPPDRVVSR
jgi:FkbM family methyltransferase